MKFQNTVQDNLIDWSFKDVENELEKLSKYNIENIPVYIKFLADIGRLDIIKVLSNEYNSNPFIRKEIQTNDSFSVCRNLFLFENKVYHDYKEKESFFNKLYVYSLEEKIDKVFSLLTTYRGTNLKPSTTAEQNMILAFAINRLIKFNYLNVEIIRHIILHIASCNNMSILRKRYLLKEMVMYCVSHKDLAQDFFDLKNEYVIHIRLIPLIHTLSNNEYGAYKLQSEVYNAIKRYNDLSLGFHHSPKIAICISGMFKSDLTNLDDIYSKLVKPLNADVFIHCWDRQQTWAGDVRRYNFWNRVFGINNSSVPSKLLNLDFLENNFPNIYSVLLSSSFKELDFNSIKERISSKLFLVENEDEFLTKNNIDNNYKSRDTFNQVKMFYGIYRCFKLVKRYEVENNFQYDYIIRLRADTVVKENHISLEHLYSLDDHSVAVHAGSGWGISDGFFYTTRGAYEKIANLWESILEAGTLSPFTCFPNFDAHKLLGLWLIKNNILPIPWKLNCGTIMAGSNFKVPYLQDNLIKDCNAINKEIYKKETEWLVEFFKDKSL